ncbi:MAG TPA: hypothetical protein VMR90_10620 [Candidatus Cybelea sp.]|nr:hypothetical protein [Candidatus Cybelea sp.]
MAERNGAETRRSARMTLRVPLKIYERGSSSRNRFLDEEAYAVKVSLWGGLIAFGAPVERDQTLYVFNQATGEIAESQVVYLRPMRLAGGLGLVGIKFLKPSPGFWGVDFPTLDPCRAQAKQQAAN